MNDYTFPIVGSFYREIGTKAILDSLAIGTPLFLRAEPTNHVDPFAIAVWINPSAIGEAAKFNLEKLLPSYGLGLQDVMSRDEWQVGYIPKDLAKVWELKADAIGSFAVGGNNGPRIKVVDLDESLKRQSKEQVANSKLLRSQLKASVETL